MKKRNEEEPENLGGLGDVLPADVLKLLNELLERMHQAENNKQGSKIEFVYVASGGQHVERQINIGPHPSPSLTPDPSPQGEGSFKGREKGVKAKESFNDDTPLSALFRENHHEALRKVIESWRPYLINDEKATEALSLTHFEFDKDQIYSNKVYRDLCELDALGALQVSLSQLAHYLAVHSNLSQSYATLYQQLKYYRCEFV